MKEYPLENMDLIMEIKTKMREVGINISQLMTKMEPPELILIIPESDYNTRKNEIIRIVKEASKT